MKRLTEAECLLLWERGRELHPIDQGLLALETACAALPQEDPADWPLGRRNQALAQLYCTCFGTRVRGWTACAACAEKMEFDIDGASMAESAAPGSEARVQTEYGAFRLPTSRDLAFVAGAPNAELAANLLLERTCLNPAQLAVEELKDEEREDIGDQLAAADPLAEIVLEFHCTNCGERFEQGLELAAFVWAELESRARRLLWDVHLLASTYGWREGEILALSPVRRSLYLEMVQA